MIKIRKLISIDYYHLISELNSNFANCPTNILYSAPPENLSSHIAFSCHIFLVFFGLEQFHNITGDTSFDHLVKMVYTRFLHYKVTILPFVVSIYLCEDILRL